MATESSAVASFINLVQQEGFHDTAQVEPIDLSQTMQVPAPGRGLKVTVIVLASILGVGAAVVGGYTLARSRFEGDGSPAAASAAKAIGAPASAASTADSARPGAALADETKASVNADNSPAELAAAAQDVEPSAAAAAASTDETGFDIVVKPSGISARVSLDGHPIGVAPLRVRNLAPGRHAIDIEAPEGFFGKHLELDLKQGSAQTIELALEPVDSADGAAAGVTGLAADAPSEDADADDESDKVNKDESRSERRARTRAERRAKRRARLQAAKERTNDEKVSARAAADDDRDDDGGAAGGASGMLMLGAKPPCEIYIDGKKTGMKTPQRSISLPVGLHRIKLVNREHNLTKKFKVKISEGKLTRAIQDFTGEI